MQNEYENDDIILSFHGMKGFHRGLPVGFLSCNAAKT